jgi:hypothetical protein
MARQSTRKSMTTVSVFLFLAVAGLITAGVFKIRHDYLLNGTELVGWAFVPLAVLLGFTLPVTCGVKRTNSKECGNRTYGLLFGCRQAAGHWSRKFLLRLGLRRDEVTAHKPKGSYVMNQPAPSRQKSGKDTVEESALAKCGFWVGLTSGIVGLIQAVIALVH